MVVGWLNRGSAAAAAAVDLVALSAVTSKVKCAR